MNNKIYMLYFIHNPFAELMIFIFVVFIHTVRSNGKLALPK